MGVAINQTHNCSLFKVPRSMFKVEILTPQLARIGITRLSNLSINPSAITKDQFSGNLRAGPYLLAMPESVIPACF
jgi:hypothetical protein